MHSVEGSSAPSIADRRRPRGRPTVIDSGAIAEAAFRLWRERGFDQTSWADIAEATGISTRTLIRHFRSKADIAWVGVPEATARLREALDQAPSTATLADAIRTGVVESVSHDARVQRVNEAWLRLIVNEPELAAMASAAYRPWIEELAAFIGRRVPDASPAVCTALATAYQAAAFAALTAWADGGAPGDSADAVDAMLRWLDIAVPHVRADPTST